MKGNQSDKKTEFNKNGVVHTCSPEQKSAQNDIGAPPHSIVMMDNKRRQITYDKTTEGEGNTTTKDLDQRILNLLF